VPDPVNTDRLAAGIVDRLDVTIVSDRWGDPLERSDAVGRADRDACARLAAHLVDEQSFVARVVDAGDMAYGILVEIELAWPRSDDADVVALSWGRPVTDAEALAAAERVCTHLVRAARMRGMVATGTVVTDPAEMYDGRLGVRCFVPEPHATVVPALADTLSGLTPAAFVDPDGTPVA